ncbi:MAG: translation initiation factor IF-2 [bacterium]|nr:translation initiation factor IF-2 [bacterium]
MGKMRAHELAKELGIQTKELLAYFKKEAPEIKSNLSVVPEEVAKEVRSKFSDKGVLKGSLKGTKTRKKAKPKVEFKVRKRKKPAPKPKEPVEEVAAEAVAVEQEEKSPEQPPAVDVPPAEIQEPAAEAVVAETAPEAAEPAAEPAAPVEVAPQPAEAVAEKERLTKKEKKKGKKGEAKGEEQETDSRVSRDKAKKKRGKLSLAAEKIDRPASKKKKILPTQLLELQVRRTPKKLRAKPKKKTKVAKVKREVEEEVAVEQKTNVIRWDETTTLKDVSEQINVPVNDLILKFMGAGSMVTVNQPVDADSLELVADEYGYEVERVSVDTDEGLIFEVEDKPENLVPRPPVVTIMGHVDHGKTSLLDVIRETNVVGDEAGGITQHIGAYTVKLKDKTITFLDTPGHEAFTSMRARGAKVTDIVVLVVAADDGVMPQTIEAIHHAAAAQVPIVVAVNKIDKPEARPERIRQQLAEHNLAPEDWGGQTIFTDVSAKKRQGIEDLLEMILLQSDIMELKADPQRPAVGTIVEARLDKARGPVATVLVQTGTVKVGDSFVTGAYAGKVRAMLNDRGKKITSAGPSTPVEILGMAGVPMAGESFIVVEDERKARQIGIVRFTRMREAALSKGHRVTLDDLYQRIQEGEVKELPIIIKGDVQGSVEALSDTLERLSTTAVELKVIHGSVGGITETDINLAAASNAIVIGFNVRPEPKAAALAEAEKVDVRLYNVIYDAANDVRNAMEGLLEPLLKERILGRAEVRQVFSISKVGTVAGSYVVDGTLERSAQVRLIRDSVVVHEGKASTLRRFKDDVKEVATGYECGVTLENYNDIKVNDILEFYTYDKVAAKL